MANDKNAKAKDAAPASQRTERIFDFTGFIDPKDLDLYDIYHRLKRVARQLRRSDLMPDGKIMTEDEVRAILEQAPKKNAAATASANETDDAKGGNVAASEVA